jgi:hypothetical protein
VQLLDDQFVDLLELGCDAGADLLHTISAVLGDRAC